MKCLQTWDFRPSLTPCVAWWGRGNKFASYHYEQGLSFLPPQPEFDTMLQMGYLSPFTANIGWFSLWCLRRVENCDNSDWDCLISLIMLTWLDVAMGGNRFVFVFFVTDNSARKAIYLGHGNY